MTYPSPPPAPAFVGWLRPAPWSAWYRPGPKARWRRIGAAVGSEAEAWRLALAYPLSGDKTVSQRDPNDDRRPK